jgi:membrane-associated phospholipid phosphatase
MIPVLRVYGGFRWPSETVLLRFVQLWALLTVLFVTVYAGADFLTSLHNWRIHPYFAGELAIPLLPVMVVPYMSVYLPMLLAPLVLKTSAELDALAIALAKVIVIAGIGFLLLPVELGFAPVAETLPGTATGTEGFLGRTLLLADRLNLDYNAIPSLHVALLTACLGTYLARVRLGARIGFALWVALVAASTLLTHQHHLIDVAAGMGLGIWGARCALRRAGLLLRWSNGGLTP